jgi:hypothetical protein
MLHRIRDRFGTAGLAVAVIALVAALAGGAYAASGGLTGKQKKEVKKIARTEAKKFQGTGPQGPKGDTGAQGAKGDAGAKGENGSAGSPGANGKSVEVGATGPSGACGELGGAKVQVTGEPATAQEVCNGETGFTSTLPSEQTETGTWWFQGNGKGLNASEQASAISFPIPLAAADAAGMEAYFAPNTECPGTVNKPEAEPGALCIYKGASNTNATGIYQPDFTTAVEDGGLGISGVLLYFEGASTEAASGGTFAVTAP